MSESASSSRSPEDNSASLGAIPDRRVRVAEGLIERNVGGQTFVLTPNSQLHILENPTARHLWSLVHDAGDGGITATALVTDLIAHFQVDHGIAQTDVASYLDHLLEVEVFEIMSP